MTSGPVVIQVLEGQKRSGAQSRDYGRHRSGQGCPGHDPQRLRGIDRGEFGARLGFCRECRAGDRLLLFGNRNLPLAWATESSGLISDPAKRQLAACFEAGIGTAALLFFPLLVLVPRGVAALVSAAGLCAAGLVLLRRGLEPRLLFGCTPVMLACLLVWAAISAFWSLDPWRSLFLAARLAGIFAAGLALIAAVDRIAVPRRLVLALLVGLAAGIVMVSIELATQGSLGALVSERAYQFTRLNQASVSFCNLAGTLGRDARQSGAWRPRLGDRDSDDCGRPRALWYDGEGRRY